MIIALCSVIVNALAAYLFRDWLSGYAVSPEYPGGLGHVGVALATSAVALVNFFALALMMRRRIARLNGRAIISAFLRIAVASAVMSAVCYFSYTILLGYLGIQGFIVKFIETFVPIGLGGLTFFAAAKILKVAEVDKLYNALARKLKR
jgi:putative peptidoglycan lipid II flippase